MSKYWTILVLNFGLIPSVFSMEAEVLFKMTQAVGDSVLECQNEIHFDYDIIFDLKNYWDPSYKLRDNLNTGCIILCAFVKLGLLDTEKNIKPQNVQAFTKANGGDDEMGSRLTALYRLCVSAVDAVPNACDTATEILKCLRYGLYQLRWAPDKLYIKTRLYDE